jgi:hypothetical protein
LPTAAISSPPSKRKKAEGPGSAPDAARPSPLASPKTADGAKILGDLAGLLSGADGGSSLAAAAAPAPAPPPQPAVKREPDSSAGNGTAEPARQGLLVLPPDRPRSAARSPREGGVAWGGMMAESSVALKKKPSWREKKRMKEAALALAAQGLVLPPSSPASSSKIPPPNHEAIAFEKVRAVMNQVLQRVIDECSSEADLQMEVEEQETLSIRLEPLGADRFHTRFWWSPSDPSRLWVEEVPVPRAGWPALVKAWSVAADAALPDEERIHCVIETIYEHLMALDIVALRELALLARVPVRPGAAPQEEYTDLDKAGLVEKIIRCDVDGVVTTVALQQATAEAGRRRMGRAPRHQVQELLELAGLPFRRGMPRRELARCGARCVLLGGRLD